MLGRPPRSCRRQDWTEFLRFFRSKSHKATRWLCLGFLLTISLLAAQQLVFRTVAQMDPKSNYFRNSYGFLSGKPKSPGREPPGNRRPLSQVEPGRQRVPCEAVPETEMMPEERKFSNERLRVAWQKVRKSSKTEED